MRFSPWLYGLKIRFAAGVGLLLMLVGAPFFYLFYTLHRDRSIDSLKQATTDMSRVLVATIERPMFERQPHTLPDAVTRLVNPDLVQRVLIADKNGRVVVSSDPSLVGQRVPPESPSCRICHEQSPASRQPATILTRELSVEVFRTMRPIFNRLECHRCHAPTKQLNGILMLDYSTAPTRLGAARASRIRLEKDTHYLFLDEDTDYLFCPVCRIHVPCQRLESGGWEVQCPGCVGECVRCTCYLKQFCFGSRQEFPPFQKPARGDKD